MATACLDCGVALGVGPMSGDVGLPSLDATPRGTGNHRLSKVLSSGADADGDETFGYIESGFRAVGLRIHAFDVYRRFLEGHAAHRLYLWADQEAPDVLPKELRDPSRLKWLKYTAPAKKDGYVNRILAIECRECEDDFEGDSPDWVMPLKATKLGPDEIRLFSKVALACELAMHEAEPFDIVYPDLGEWLAGHESHKPTIKLRSDAS